LHGHLNASVNEDLTKIKEFRSQDNSVFQDKNDKKSRPQIKRPATAKNKGNLNNPEVDMIDKIEKERQQVKSFPLKKWKMWNVIILWVIKENIRELGVTK